VSDRAPRNGSVSRKWEESLPKEQSVTGSCHRLV
jgi:hypothetical protein